MRAAEFATEQQLNEINWRATGAAGIAGAIGGGLATHNPQPTEPAAQVMQIDNPSPVVGAPLAAQKPIPSKETLAHAKSLLNNPEAKLVYQTAVDAGITGTELAQFMAQCAHETMNFTTRRERGGKEYFMRKYDKQYNPANAQLLGNTKPGDGARYFGRGDIQLSGRENYRRVGQALGLPLEDRPELAERADIAAKIAVYFWKNRVQPRVDDFTDTAAVTKPINRKLVGLDDRHAKFTGLDHLLTAKEQNTLRTAQLSVSKASGFPTTRSQDSLPLIAKVGTSPNSYCI